VTSHLVGVSEIAEMLGVSRQRVVQIIAAYGDFPEPEAFLASGRVWKRKAVREWMRSHSDRRPGRPRHR
jgi:predicted DNA-binding transcriptional regulator AlpA